MSKIFGSECFREERAVQEAREKDEQGLQLLIEMEEVKKKKQELATEQVRKVKVSVSHSSSLHSFLCLFQSQPSTTVFYSAGGQHLTIKKLGLNM